MARRHHRTVIRREHPVHTPLWRLGVALLVLVALGVAFYGGAQWGGGAPLPYDDRADALRTQVVALQTQREVDVQTLAVLREELATSRASIDELERELAFYRGVIAPEEMTAGVMLRAPVLRAGNVPGIWHYQLVAQQGGQTRQSGRTVHTGELLVTFWGEQQGVPQSYTLTELDDALASAELTLSFRYFQRREGTFTLPPGFTPERVELQLAMVKPERQSLEQSYTWDELVAQSASQ